MGALIVFLPGLTGNEKTWGIIPSLIKRTPGIEFEVATETYSTGIFSPSDLSRSAAVILTRLENQYAGYSPIYLVGHSLGGLIAREVCRQLLVGDRSKDGLLDTVQAVITLGTPIEGAKPWRFSSLEGAWNAVLNKTPFLGKKVKQIGDPKANYERYKAAYSATIWMGSRIASPVDAPECDRLPHLFCSRLGLRRRPGAEMAGVSERPASSAGVCHIIGLL